MKSIINDGKNILRTSDPILFLLHKYTAIKWKIVVKVNNSNTHDHTAVSNHSI
ncbi:MAG: hypothetical protein IPM51_10370 [Sphingobacteriaceae bacterium]|nr:hypothetical protein [Sphingobacteriaceae bacterium]